MSQTITIVTRNSALALVQANQVKHALLQHHPTLQIDLLTLTTTGDKILNQSLDKLGGKGLFVKELEQALLDGRADLAVHSAKDVPMDLPEGLCLAAFCQREDARDVFISNNYASIADLPTGAIIGTSSLRRQLQIKSSYSTLKFALLRGNIATRLHHLDRDDYDAIVLAAAGLHRLGLTDRIGHYLTIKQGLPAAGQGALALECRANDTSILALSTSLNHAATASAVLAERALCRRIGGGCSVPIAAYAVLEGNTLRLQGWLSNHDASRILRTNALGAAEEAESIGLHAAEDLIQQGAIDILREFE